MSGKIGNIIQEYIFGLSILSAIIGLIVLIFGVLEMWMPNVINLQEDVSSWSLYILIAGFIIFITGIWYLTAFLKNKKFLLKELETKKRSEFMKRHAELQEAARHLPSKYKKMLSEKEASLKIK